MKLREKNRVIELPCSKIVGSEPFQKRLAIVLANLPDPKSRRDLFVEVPRTIINFKGTILLSNGMPYPRHNVDSCMGHESGRQISMFMELVDGELRYKPRTLTFPRLLALYTYVAIKWPLIAAHIVT